MSKSQTGILDGTPDKRLFWSIISDYDTATALCELVDNAVDRWWPQRHQALHISIDLDLERQLLAIEDSAGGVSKEDLRYLIAPGGSNNDPESESIGVFGVGSKRAAMALAESVTVKKTRTADGDTTFQLDITKDWAESPGWDIPFYETTNISGGTTSITMSGLRRVITANTVADFSRHLGYVYCRFLQTGISNFLSMASQSVLRHLTSGRFPKGHEPRAINMGVNVSREGTVRAIIKGGLIYERDTAEENYGVRIDCATIA